MVLREYAEPTVEPDHSVAASVAAQAAGAEHVTRLTAVPRSAPTGSRSPPTSTCSRRRAGCPTCTTSASTGSTCRRCSRPSPAATTATTWSAHDRVDESRGGAAGLAALSAEARRPRAGRARRHRAQPRGHRRRRSRARGGGTCCAWARSRRTRRRSTSTGRPAAAGSSCRCSATTPTRRRSRCVDGERCATTTTPSRSRPAPATAAERGCTTAALRLVSWREADHGLNYRRFFAVNTLAAVRVEDRTVLRRHPRRDQALVRRGAGRRPAGRPPRRAARPGRATSTTWPSSPAAPTCWWRRSWSPARSCRRRGRPPARPATTRSAHIDRVLTDPARPGGARRPRDPAARRARRLAPAHPRHQAGRGRRHPRLRGAPDRAGAVVAEPRAVDERTPTPSRTRLVDAVAELLACFPVYRSYLPEGRSTSTTAFARARAHRPDLADDARRARAGAGRPDGSRRPSASSRPAAW